MPVNANDVSFAGETQYASRTQYGTSGNADGKPEYIGFAAAGTVSTEAAWQIKRLTYDSSGRVTAIEFANGSTDFNQAFVTPENLTYK